MVVADVLRNALQTGRVLLNCLSRLKGTFNEKLCVFYKFEPAFELPFEPAQMEIH